MAILFVAAIVLSGCTKSSTPTTPAPSPEPAKKPITIALVPKLVHPFFEDCRKGGDAKAKELGVAFQWVAPPTGDPAGQVRMIEDLVSKGVSGIAISPNEPKSVEAVIADAIAKGIKVITFDSDSPGSKRLMYIGTDNKQAGVVMGETLAKLVGGKGEVAIITGGLGALNLNQRIDGVKEALAKYPDIKLVDTQGTDDDLAKGLTAAEAMLRSRPNLVGIFGISATGGPSAAKALAETEFAARRGKVKVVAFDDLQETVKGIEDGLIDATMVQKPVQMGALSVQWLKDIIEGKAQPKNIDTGVTVVNKENLKTYTK
jgi:ribose transport system substrate-binding protein